MPFKIMSQNIKYLGINFTKGVGSMNHVNMKILNRRALKIKINGTIVN